MQKSGMNSKQAIESLQEMEITLFVEIFFLIFFSKVDFFGSVIKQ